MGESEAKDSDYAVSKEERRKEALQATEESARSGHTLQDQDIEVTNLVTRLARSRLVAMAVEQGIWFDSADVTDHYSDNDPDPPAGDPWHGGAPVPLPPVDDIWV